MTVSEMVDNGSFYFEVPFNVVRYINNDSFVLYSNFSCSPIPENIGSLSIKNVVMRDGYIDIEV